MDENISPMQLFGATRVFSTKEVKDKPIIACGKKYYFTDVIEINIQKQELKSKMVDNKETPGVMINEGCSDAIFVTMDDDSLKKSRAFCIALAKGINTKVLNEMIETRDEAERAFNENDEAAKKMGLIVSSMK